MRKHYGTAYSRIPVLEEADRGTNEWLLFCCPVPKNGGIGEVVLLRPCFFVLLVVWNVGMVRTLALSLSFGFLFIGNENLFFLATDALVAQRESTV